MTEKRHGPLSSEERIKQAKKALQPDRISPSSVPREEGSLEDRRPVPAMQPTESVIQKATVPNVPASRTDEQPRRGWIATLAISAGVAFSLLALLFAVVLIDGTRKGDPEVTGNIAGFLILIGLTLLPGALLVTWGLRRQGANRADSSALSRRIRWPRLAVVALLGTPAVIAVYTLLANVLGLSNTAAGMAVTVVVGMMAKLALDWVLD